MDFHHSSNSSAPLTTHRFSTIIISNTNACSLIIEGIAAEGHYHEGKGLLSSRIQMPNAYYRIERSEGTVNVSWLAESVAEINIDAEVICRNGFPKTKYR